MCSGFVVVVVVVSLEGAVSGELKVSVLGRGRDGGKVRSIVQRLVA